MKKLIVYKSDDGITLERINQFSTSFKREFATENGLLEALTVYRNIGLFKEYEVFVSEDLEEFIQKRIQELMT